MAKPVVFGIGKLGLRLAVAFLGVALAAIIILSWLTEVGAGNDINDLAMDQERALSKSVAAAASSIYAQPPAGWPQGEALKPVLDVVMREGAAAEVRDLPGHVIQRTPGFLHFDRDHEFTTPVTVHGRSVGEVSVRFGDGGLGSVVSTFESERLRASLGAAGIVALIALVVSLLISRQITLPLERVLAAIRARGEGDRSMRIGDVKGAGVVHELSVALNESSDAIDERDRLQRNLVANIAHELRTPVAILQASHEAMLDGVTQPTTENLWSLRDEVLRLARMIEDLQRLAAAEAAALQLKLVPRNLAAIAEDATSSLRDSFGTAGISLDTRLSTVWVRCDPDRMREVIVNLLTNALKFTPADGAVMLETGTGGRGLGKLTVSDTGIGIPADELPRVTERFFRGQRSAQMATGSGIGLTIVAELMRAQHGRFTITSEQGKGTVATIMVPLGKKPSGHARHLPERSESGTAAGCGGETGVAARQRQGSAAWS
ncbi:MAG TPA: HAMP domain-containing sensor histidine kinase [Streptosporangiaceae bacterium]|nr:HAMP domain-containing sensor histidine kinase [Streptosporangiaceae bacterium]